MRQEFLHTEMMRKRARYRRWHRQERYDQIGDPLEVLIGLTLAGVGFWSACTSDNGFSVLYSLFICGVGIGTICEAFGFAFGRRRRWRRKRIKHLRGHMRENGMDKRKGRHA